MAKDTLERLETFLSRFDAETMTKKDFEDAFSKVLDLVQAILTKHEQGIKDLQATHEQLMGNVRDETNFSLSDIKGQVNNLFVGDKLKEMLQKIDAKLATVRDGAPGIQGRPGVGTPGRPGRDGSSDSPQQIVSKLNSLKGVLNLDVIKGVKDALKLLDQKVTYVSSKGGAAAPRGRITFYDLSSRLDGSQKVFTLPAYWAIFGVFSSSSPGVLRPTIDYTLTNSEITFTSQIDATTQLASGTTLIIQFEEA